MIRWCFTHDIGWYQHPRDETCREEGRLATTSLKKFKTSELAAALNIKLSRGRPSKMAREWFETEVLRDMGLGYVKVRKGALVRV